MKLRDWWEMQSVSGLVGLLAAILFLAWAMIVGR